MDIGAWLRQLGLERYEQAFRDSDIVPAVLPGLTDQDLTHLGVSLGHRRLLLKAIRALVEDRAGNSRAEVPPAPPPERATILTVAVCHTPAIERLGGARL